MLTWPFSRSRAASDGARLLAAVEAASRRPDFYGSGKVADTLEGRFELLALNAALALVRLKLEPGAQSLAQDFTDRFFRSLDAGLRESGVGDLTVPKKMRRLAGEFYGRVNTYSAALAARDEVALTAAIARNIVTADAALFATHLAANAAMAAGTQAEAPLEILFSAEGWPGLVR